MQKVTSMLPSWEKTKTGTKSGFDWTWQKLDKLGAPVNKLSNKIGSEAFWPTTLDKESDKAARILKSFCKDGFYAEDDRPKNDGSAIIKGKQRVLKKIPQKVIQNAVGLAIFTTMRTGLWVSGAGGSGVLIARKEDGTWSPPSGILLHTAGLGFLVGVDIYDCVVVINNRKALDSFTKIRATIGGEISAVAGPAGIGGILENDGKWKQANRPVFTYLKSRGFYAGVQVDGTVVIERTDENERFYGQKLSVSEILAGKARHPPYEIKMLMETVKAAEGSPDVDQKMMQQLEDEPAPADMELSSPHPDGHTFGIPDSEDPDPFGVLALEKEGLEIREAGTRSRPPSTQFEFNPSPTSPVYDKFHRKSMDTLGGMSNRDSYMSTLSSRARLSIDRGTQTFSGAKAEGRATPVTSPTLSNGESRIKEEDPKSPVEVDYTKIDMGPYSNLQPNQELDGTTISESPREREEEGHAHDTSFEGDDDEDEEETVVFEAAQALTPQAGLAVKARGGLVNIPKRPPPPPLPPRSVARGGKAQVDQSSGQSPAKEEFEQVDLHGLDAKSGGSVRNSKEIPKEETPTAQDHSAKEATHVEEAAHAEEHDREEKPAIVMQDLEKEGEECPDGTGHTPFDERLDYEVAQQHLERLNTNTHQEEALANESQEMKTMTGEEEEKFHSIPTTPGEVEVK